MPCGDETRPSSTAATAADDDDDEDGSVAAGAAVDNVEMANGCAEEEVVEDGDGDWSCPWIRLLSRLRSEACCKREEVFKCVVSGIISREKPPAAASASF